MKKFVIIWMNGEVDTMADENKIEENKEQSDYISRLTSRIKDQITEISDLHKKNNSIYQQIGELEQELSEKENMLQELQMQQEEILSEKDQLLVKLQKEIEQLKKENDKKEKQLKKENDKKEKQLNESKKSLKEITERNEQLQREVEAHAAREKALSDQIVQMENSRSWKITKPLRALYWKSHG